MRLSVDNKAVVAAVVRLKSMDDFKLYMAFLQSRLDGFRKLNDNLTGDALKWNQGKCQAIQEIINDPDLAMEIKRKHP